MSSAAVFVWGFKGKASFHLDDFKIGFIYSWNGVSHFEILAFAYLTKK